MTRNISKLNRLALGVVVAALIAASCGSDEPAVVKPAEPEPVETTQAPTTDAATPADVDAPATDEDAGPTVKQDDTQATTTSAAEPETIQAVAPSLIVDPITVSEGLNTFTIEGAGFDPNLTTWTLLCPLPSGVSEGTPEDDLIAAMSSITAADCDLSTSVEVQFDDDGSFSTERDAIVIGNFMWVASDSDETQVAAAAVFADGIQEVREDAIDAIIAVFEDAATEGTPSFEECRLLSNGEPGELTPDPVAACMGPLAAVLEACNELDCAGLWLMSEPEPAPEPEGLAEDDEPEPESEEPAEAPETEQPAEEPEPEPTTSSLPPEPEPEDDPQPEQESESQQATEEEQPPAEQPEETEQAEDAVETPTPTDPPQEEADPEDSETDAIYEATTAAIIEIAGLTARAVPLWQSGNAVEACALAAEARVVADAHEAAFGAEALAQDEVWLEWLDVLDDWDAACAETRAIAEATVTLDNGLVVFREGYQPPVHPDTRAPSWERGTYVWGEFPDDRPRATEYRQTWIDWCGPGWRCESLLFQMTWALDYLGANESCVVNIYYARASQSISSDDHRVRLINEYGWHRCATVIDPVQSDGRLLSEHGLSMAERCRAVLPADVKLEYWELVGLNYELRDDVDCDEWGAYVEGRGSSYKDCDDSARLAEEWLEHYIDRPERFRTLSC